MKIAYIISQYPAVSHTFIDREIRAVRGAGIEVHAISLRGADPSHLLTDADRAEAARTWAVLPPGLLELGRAHASTLLRSPRRYFSSLGLALRLGKAGARGMLQKAFYFGEAVLVHRRLQAQGIHHIHAHFANSANWVALLTANLGGPTCSYSWTMHGPSEFDDVVQFAVRDKIRAANFVACIGDYCRSQLMRYVEPDEWDKLIVVRCGVDTDSFSPAPRVSPAKPGTRLLTVARLVPNKGQTLLLEALAELRRDGYDLELVMAGEGPARRLIEDEILRLGIGDAVRLVGNVGQDAIHDLYANCDVFVLPSLAEGVPVVLMEAMACGLPVIASNITGVSELVEDGRSGLLVRPGNGPDLIRALRLMSGNSDAHAEMGRLGRERVVAEFAMPGVVRPLVEAFRTLGSR